LWSEGKGILQEEILNRIFTNIDGEKWYDEVCIDVEL
jgi:hypothetical protein